jgi:glyoxylase-like metal-dependent hydrolase (beta-lactamase superfamily II)
MKNAGQYRIVTRVIGIALMLALACLVLAPVGTAQAAAEVVLQPVGPGVFVALVPFANRFNDSNATVIVTNDSVIVIDTQTTLSSTRAVLAAIRKMTDKPVRYVIDTHWHGDHVYGNQIYCEAFPGVELIAQTNTREDMVARAAKELRDNVDSLPGRIEKAKQQLVSGLTMAGKPLTDEQKTRLQAAIDATSAQLPELRQIHIVLPDITFDQSMTLFEGGKEIHLIHYLGHTRGDVVVLLPAEKILVTADLLDDMPYTGHGSPASLVQTLRALDKLDYDTIIPGHGAVEHGRDHLHQVADLFESIVAQVKAAVTAGLSLEDTKKKVDVEKFRGPLTGGEEHATNAFNGFVPAAIERAYQEATGTIKD